LRLDGREYLRSPNWPSLRCLIEFGVFSATFRSEPNKDRESEKETDDCHRR
jgi:hypothetical protein